MNDAPPALRLTAVKRSFRQKGGETLAILRGVDLRIEAGNIVALVGASGSGKSSLLHIAGLLDAPDAGSVAIDGLDASALSKTDLARLRRERLGFVHQYHFLLNEWTALDNAAMPAMLKGTPRAAARKLAERRLIDLGLGERLHHRPAHLSGGERQRTAVARALCGNPTLLIADEPTGNLDEKHAADVFALLLAGARRHGVAALIATHDEKAAAAADRRVILERGKVLER